MNTIEISIENEKIDNILQGFSITERKDDEFDSFQFINCLSNHKEPYDPGKDVMVKINNIKYLFVVNKDSVEIYSKHPTTYLHNIELIEKTAIFDHCLNESITFSSLKANERTLEKYLDRYRNIYPLERKDLHLVSRKLNFSLLEDDKKIKMPEMKLNYGSVFSQMKQLSSICDSIFKVNSENEIELDKFNKRGKKIERDDNVVNEKDFYDLMSKNTSIHQFLQTAIPDVESNSLTKSHFKTTRTEEVVATTDNSNVILNYPIEKIIKVEAIVPYSRKNDVSVKKNNKGYYTIEFNNNIFEPYLHDGHFGLDSVEAFLGIQEYGKIFYKSVDITEFIFLKEEWDTFDVDKNPDHENNYKNNTLYYSVGDNQLRNVTDKSAYEQAFGKTDTKYPIEEVLYRKKYFVTKEVLNNSDRSEVFYFLPNEFPLNNLSLRITYIPQISLHTKMSKSCNDFDYLVNQSSDKIEMSKQGMSIKNLLKRMGHSDRTIIRINPSYDEVNHTGDYLEDDYIITNAQHIIFRDYVVSIEQYNKNFNKTALYTSLDQSNRVFAVSDKPTYRDLNYTEYVVVDNNKIEGTKAMIEDIDLFMSSLKNIAFDHSIEVALIQTYDKNGQALIGKNNQSAILPIVKSTYGNSIIFYFMMKNKTSIGDRKVENASEGTYKVMDPVIYTDKNGEFDSLSFSLCNLNTCCTIVEELPYKSDTYYFSFKNYKAINDFSNMGNGEEFITPDGKLYRRAFVSIVMNGGAPIGYFETFIELDPIDYVFDFNSIDEVITMADNYPIISRESEQEELNAVISCDKDKALIVKKDAREIISLTYQLQIVSANKNIIIGDYFVKYNHLINNKTPKLKWYQSLKKHSYLETKKCLGFPIVNMDALGININVEDNFILLKTTKDFILMQYRFLELGDEDGNLVLAINTNTSELSKGLHVYFNFLNKLPQRKDIL